MRLGVVPELGVRAYTVGQPGVVSALEGLVGQTSDQSVVALLGDYGAGKTHWLEIASAMALEAGFVCARVVLSPEETSPSHPQRVYRALMAQLRYPDTSRDDHGLKPLLDAAVASPEALAAFCVDQARDVRRHLDRGAHLYLTPALAYWRHLDKHPQARARLLNWLEGQPTGIGSDLGAELREACGGRGHLYALKDYRPWARIYAYLLDGISAMARAVGYKGLVVLVDEAEFYALLAEDHRAHALNLFQSLAWAASGTRGLAVLPFVEDDVGHGGAGVQRELEPLFSNGSGLRVVFAMTPDPEGVGALGASLPEEARVEIPPLGQDDYTALAGRVCDFYRAAYPDALIPAGVTGPLGKVLQGLLRTGQVENPRQAMKFVIEFLDTVRYHPSEVVAVIDGIRTSSYF